MDIADGELQYAAAGINEFLFNETRIFAQGMFLGINEYKNYEIERIAMGPEDSVCFMTDGVSDVLTVDLAWGSIGAKDICHLFADTKKHDRLKDDATAICISRQ